MYISLYDSVFRDFDVIVFIAEKGEVEFGGMYEKQTREKPAAAFVLCVLIYTSPMLIGPSILLMFLFHVRFVWSICLFKFEALYYTAFVFSSCCFTRWKILDTDKQFWFDCDRD